MRIIEVETIEGIKSEKVYTVDDFPYDKHTWHNCSIKHGKNPVLYLEVSSAFDIETTNITEAERPFAFMYHWQFCLQKDVVFGRTWDEFLLFLDRLRAALYLTSSRRLVVFVHNLAFEFQFCRRFLDVESGFFKAERKPLKFTIEGVEFRDSYALSNMSLEKFCENTQGVIHYKLTDTYDYRKIRTAETPMEPSELAYCYNDVRGLCECIDEYRRHDNLANMPLTSTGFVRRDFRKSMRTKKCRDIFQRGRLSAELYQFCKDAFRGGDTHANIYWVQDTARNVESYDITSSYPFQLMVRRYPMGKWFKVPRKKIRKFLRGGKYAMLLRVIYENVEYIGTCGDPYIPISKCKHKENVLNDNGRVMKADWIDIRMTDIDFKIIEKEYKADHVYLVEAWASYYDYMPDEFKSVLMNYYRQKTLLRGDDAHIYEYGKAKNRLNAAYGMCVTDICKALWEYIEGEYKKKQESVEERLDKFYKSRNSFLSYQAGIWVTCYARLQLREMLWKVGKDVIYCDTDSIKYVGDHTEEFKKKNEELLELAEKFGAYAEDRHGRKVYMGLWDHDASYSKFKTLGAKKYCYQYAGSDDIYSTIAGVSKKVGKKFFTERGFDAFKNGTTIKDSGHLVAYYNDDDIHYITVAGCRMKTAANTALVDGDYTIGMTRDYLDLLKMALEKKAYVL